ncbi:UDP-N-acetylmuramoyl-tripeptide--D-alanyl-D-alanine ligase [Nocardioides sp. JQ2195]|uniref:UDP-N-acetylmuramoyl-tripeptide--D-alanyl-D- alanine ligase n=1 Tax=Nocardioides sp. JQ2195 TaxID=2592334 RepID=UPI003211DFE7
MSLAEIAAAVGGSVDGDPEVLVTGPAFVDSRAVEPSGLFVAIPGDRVDGHDYASGAVAGGAAGVLGSRPTGVPTVVVDDPVAALGRLSRHVVDRLPDLSLLALTGSQGKTGTKDYLAQVLSAAGPTVATAANLNNEIGVPLTVLRATVDTRFLVVEMGARGIGHIAYLCEIAPPLVASVLNVGTAHIGEFGSREAIAAAKGEILEALPEHGVAVINADDDFAALMDRRTRARVLRFGLAPGSDVTWSDVTYDDLDRASARFHIAGESHQVTLVQSGQHQLLNAAAAAALAVGVGLPADTIARALASATSLSRWRMELDELSDGTVVVNDAYNANPESMRAAISALLAISGKRAARSIAVLGVMKELGPESDADHRALGEHALASGVDVLLVVGDDAREIAEGAANITVGRGTAVCVADRAEALAWLRENIRSGDVVLVKASRAAGLERVAQELISSGRQPDHAEETQG